MLARIFQFSRRNTPNVNSHYISYNVNVDQCSQSYGNDLPHDLIMDDRSFETKGITAPRFQEKSLFVTEDIFTFRTGKVIAPRHPLQIFAYDDDSE